MKNPENYRSIDPAIPLWILHSVRIRGLRSE